MSWKDDETLEEQLTIYYCWKGLTREEVLSYMKRDFPEYSWSLATLKRQLAHFGVYKNDRSITIQEVYDAVEDELKGPGQLLGYRAMHQKLKQMRHLNVPRDLVYAIMTDLDWERMQERAPPYKRKKKKGKFRSIGPNWLLSLDGHDKLMGYKNSTYPLAIYGCIDSATRKILFLRIWTTNSNPANVGRWFFEYLAESRCLPRYLRVDKGTETGVMASIHAMLSMAQDDVLTEDEGCDRVLYGPSTTNKVNNFFWNLEHTALCILL